MLDATKAERDIVTEEARSSRLIGKGVGGGWGLLELEVEVEGVS